MKKYNLSNIMKRAWELVKKAGMNLSSGLKKAWEEAKMVRDYHLKGTEKQIKFANDLIKKMNEEFDLCRKQLIGENAPEEFMQDINSKFEAINNAFENVYAGNVIEIIYNPYETNHGAKWYRSFKFTCRRNRSINPVAQAISKIAFVE